jgi:hypothetical protein
MKLNTKKTEGVTEKIMEEELLRARLVGRSEGRYDGVAEYKQKLIKRSKKMKIEEILEEYFGLVEGNKFDDAVKGSAVDQLYSLYQEAYTPKELLKIFHKSPYSSGHTLAFLKWLLILKKGEVT